MQKLLTQYTSILKSHRIWVLPSDDAPISLSVFCIRSSNFNSVDARRAKVNKLMHKEAKRYIYIYIV